MGGTRGPVCDVSQSARLAVFGCESHFVFSPSVEYGWVPLHVLPDRREKRGEEGWEGDGRGRGG